MSRGKTKYVTTCRAIGKYFFKKGLTTVKSCDIIAERTKGESEPSPSRRFAGMAELADARDLKSRDTRVSYRFDPGFRHQYIAEWSSLVARRAHNPEAVRFKSHLRNQKQTDALWRPFVFCCGDTSPLRCLPLGGGFLRLAASLPFAVATTGGFEVLHTSAPPHPCSLSQGEEKCYLMQWSRRLRHLLHCTPDFEPECDRMRHAPEKAEVITPPSNDLMSAEVCNTSPPASRGKKRQRPA